MSIYKIKVARKVPLERVELFKEYLNATFDKYIATKEKDVTDGLLTKTNLSAITETCKAQLASCFRIVERASECRNFEIDKDFVNSIEFTDFKNDLNTLLDFKEQKYII